MISNVNVGSIKSGSGNDSITLNQRLDNGIDTGAGDDTIRIYGSVGVGWNVSGANHVRSGSGNDLIELFGGSQRIENYASTGGHSWDTHVFAGEGDDLSLIHI